jgi:putative polyketide hydroxylase
MTLPAQVPVVVVGGGFAGLSTAMFLGLHGIPSLVVEKHPGLAREIKARGIFPHAMEALTAAGVAERVRDVSGRRGAGDLAVVIAERLSGPVLKSVMASDNMVMSEITPEDWSLASQEQTEPILAERARELGAQVRFSTELVSYDQDREGVTVQLQERDTGVVRTVRTRYLVGADGWRSAVREQGGIGFPGRGTLGHMLRIFFEADLTAELAHLDGVAEGRRFALVHLVGKGKHGTFYTTGVPGRYGYFLSLTREPGDYSGLDDSYFAGLVREGLQLPRLRLDIVDVGETAFACSVAEKFTAGRVHLVGDAAKVVPPTGGLGGNTAIMDGFYLAWKLAAVLTGQAGPGLLGTHDAERRPVAEMIAEQQFAALVARAEPGLDDGTKVVPLDPATQAFGYRYAAAGAVVREPDDDGALIEDPLVPTGRPGSRAPYVRLAGGRTSTTALFGKGFVLLTDDESWERAAEAVSRRLGVGLTVHRIGGPDGLADTDGQWHKKYGVGIGGAVLVRPDRFVAWRSPGSGTQAGLERALRVVLHRPE